jgi:hypothetical protein
MPHSETAVITRTAQHRDEIRTIVVSAGSRKEVAVTTSVPDAASIRDTSVDWRSD